MDAFFSLIRVFFTIFFIFINNILLSDFKIIKSNFH